MYIKMLAHFLTALFLLILDAAWLYINASHYQKVVSRVQRVRMKINYVGAILSYAAVLIALFVIAIPQLEKQPQQDFLTCLKYGGLLGFVIYLTFNATNYAIFQNYSLALSAMDTFWGTALFTLVTYFFFKIAPLLKSR